MENEDRDRHGRGDARRLRWAHAALVDAAERGDGGAACRLGDLHREGRDGLPISPAAARRWYARSALAGDHEGQNNLGACFQHGFGGRQSYRQAAYWYRQAALGGLGCGSSNLGHCYLRGYGVLKDERAALRWFETAVAQGHAAAAEWVRQLKRSAARQGAHAPALEPDAAIPRPVHREDPFFVDVTEDVLRHGMAFLIDGPPR